MNKPDVKKPMKAVSNNATSNKPSREKAMDAVRTLIEWAGDDPNREGLIETPKRVVNAYMQFFEGYEQDPEEILRKTFEEVEGYDEMVIVKDIDLFSMCEHHMLPFIGKCHVAYLPKGKIIGLSKVPRIVDAFSRRLQVQERLTNQIAQNLEKILNPIGVGVVIEALHLCMCMRGVSKQNSYTTTSSMLGSFKKDARTRGEFLSLIPPQGTRK